MSSAAGLQDLNFGYVLVAEHFSALSRMKSESPYHPMVQDSLEDLGLLNTTPEDAESLRQGPNQGRACSCPSNSRRQFRYLMIVLVVQSVLIISFFWINLALYVKRGPRNPIFPQSLYSPAEHVIEYETRVFYEGFGADRSLYQQSPSPEVDAAWEDLYNFGVSRITKQEASRLVNQTYRLPGDEDHYVIQLDVFHQLHCLNLLRKAVHREYYTETDHLDSQRWDHCIESIRQSLMCSADITPIVWQWVDRVQEVRVMGNTIHTCRNYDKIKDWGLEHRLDHELNFTGFH
ncbi:hypothetical protein BDZ97DRAFT_1337008 [Flammula alnicola]|nr:hypothetical protein BDZ97DRAFT_1337008 [Flammula alnicola]